MPHDSSDHQHAHPSSTETLNQSDEAAGRQPAHPQNADQHGEPDERAQAYSHPHSHGAAHGHAHSHSHAHHHGSPDSNRAFPIAVSINAAFVVLEFTYGFLANSTALMADAGHNLSDVLGLLLAWGAAVLAKRQPGGRYTYGLRSTSILAALFNAMLLLVACGAIALEAIQRLLQPSPVAGMTVIAVAAAGIVVNGFSAWLFMAGSRDDINVRGAYLHMLGDAGVSLAVVVGGIAMIATGWFWLDPLLSLLIVAVIVVGSWGLLREALRLSVNAVPAHIDLQAVQSFLAAQRGVQEVQDLHVWPIGTTESALTVSLLMPDILADDHMLDRLSAELASRFNIGHTTIQVRRTPANNPCALEQQS